MVQNQDTDQKANKTSVIKQRGNLEEDFKYDGKQMDRDIVTVSQLKKLLEKFKGKLPFILPGKKP